MVLEKDLEVKEVAVEVAAIEVAAIEVAEDKTESKTFRSQAPKKRSIKKRDNREKDDLIEKLVQVNRVAKVVKGGRRFTFAALVVVGDGKGRVGFGTGKAKEVSDAVVKATKDARKSMITISLREGRTLHYDVVHKFSSSKVVMRVSKPGTGVIAGGAMRSVFEALGIQDVVAKSLGSSNAHNLVRATIYGLRDMVSPKEVSSRRSKKITDILARRSILSKVAAKALEVARSEK